MNSRTLAVAALILTLAVGGTLTAEEKPAPADKPAGDGRAELIALAGDALTALEKQDSTFKAFLAKAHAFVVFPTVGEGALIFGGGRGRGVVYRAGAPIGYAQLTFATDRLEGGGGGAFSELIVFEDAAAFERFANNRFAFSLTAAAVTSAEGAAKATAFADGAAVFVRPGKDDAKAPRVKLASQKFSFVPAAR